MAISHFRNWIGRRRPVWAAAVLFAATLTVGTCVMTPALARIATAGPVDHCPMLRHGMPAACCLKFSAAAHAIAIPTHDATPHLSIPPTGYAALATTVFTVPTIQVNRSLRPPIRAPAARHRPLFLLNCTLLN
ncbi:MAG TPA: hypothetical protein VFK96_04435 [Gammaproteobacteria bacterium]|nr:hypothetical protein [Gammaproteobacteria bacterium]